MPIQSCINHKACFFKKKEPKLITPSMELFILLLLTLSLSLLIPFLLFSYNKRRLPPGPPAIPVLGNLLWLRTSVSDIAAVLRRATKTYGPIVTLHIGSRPFIFISDRALAHKALIDHGAAFSDRPAPGPATKFISSNQHNISAAPYGPLWRHLRRNLISEILHSSRVKIYSDGRDWVVNLLLNRLKTQSNSGASIVVIKDSIQFAMFCLLVLMCYGEKLDEDQIQKIEDAHRDFLLYSQKLNVFAFLPRISKYIFWSRWKKANELRGKQKEVCLPLIEARIQHKNNKRAQDDERFVYSYLDSILDIKLADEGGRALTVDELQTICAEFMNAGTDTTATALQWIMAELVRKQEVQTKLREEVDRVASESGGVVREEDLQKMPYLKSVILEGLRRHSPAHFVLPHAVSQDLEFEGYVIPKRATVNFLVAEMHYDKTAWEDPMEFRPERFLEDGEGKEVDITGTREIRMMPFGAGRRICPGLGLAMLHLEYFVAQLVRAFEWKGVEGEDIDLTEKPEFTMVMKNPLRCRLIPRE